MIFSPWDVGLKDSNFILSFLIQYSEKRSEKNQFEKSGGKYRWILFWSCSQRFRDNCQLEEFFLKIGTKVPEICFWKFHSWKYCACHLIPPDIFFVFYYFFEGENMKMGTLSNLKGTLSIACKTSPATFTAGLSENPKCSPSGGSIRILITGIKALHAQHII